MRRRATVTAATVVLAASLPAAAASAAAMHQHQTIVCGYVMDQRDSGTRQALSLIPGKNPYHRERFRSEHKSNAWQLCTAGSGSTLIVGAKPGHCADESSAHYIIYSGCSSKNAVWNQVGGADGNGFNYQNNDSGRWMCAGKNTGDDYRTVAHRSSCSHGFDKFLIASP